MKRGLLILGGIVAAALVVVLVSRQRNPWTGRVQPLSMTSEDEAELGEYLAPRMSEELGGLDLSVEAQGMATAVGDRIVAGLESGRGEYRFRFHVLADTALAEAYALPGGPVFLTRGLLDRLENEAQLAGVIAHQVAHVLARHPGARFARNDTAAAAVEKVLQLRYEPDEEAEADTLSVRLVGGAGFDPRALIELMRISEEATRESGGRGFSSRHLGVGDRGRLLTEAIERAYPGGVPSTLTLGRWFAPEPPEPGDPIESLHPADSASVLD
jgi:beta-barrel assembly-enhancing protease